MRSISFSFRRFIYSSTSVLHNALHATPRHATSFLVRHPRTRSPVDNLTNGDAIFVSSQVATSQQLAFVNAAGNAIIKVDNTSQVPFNQKRNTVRISTTDSYPVGSLWVADMLHIPFGCRCVFPLLGSMEGRYVELSLASVCGLLGGAKHQIGQRVVKSTRWRTLT